jgi:hypothetical protein
LDPLIFEVRKCFLGGKNIQRETSVKMCRAGPVAGALKIDYQRDRRA